VVISPVFKMFSQY